MDGNTATPAATEFPLIHLYFYLTEACNLRCRHCWIVPERVGTRKSSTEIDVDLFRHVVEQAKPLGLSTVKLTGGEPLIHTQIVQILDYLSLVKGVNRKVLQNLIGALIYNVVGIPVAIFGLLSPLVAVTAMFLSSLTVTGNTLLLIKRYSK